MILLKESLQDPLTVGRMRSPASASVAQHASMQISRRVRAILLRGLLLQLLLLLLPSEALLMLRLLLYNWPGCGYDVR